MVACHTIRSRHHEAVVCLTPISIALTGSTDMSFGVGVSDILFFVNQTLEIYGQCRSAPAELQVAGRNVEQMRAALQILGEAVADKESLLANQPAM